ncbi:hypothetical protein [Rhizobium sp. PL01]|uniref:hypothetical protein n=1 Tax=Rhizobium sp. PL01 TaxID=3085631 RepID=UPI0029813AB6|nr:hypothetical protein [Rhizobium sp. PL01]MDW5315946.1 hypothetical protein [Rhizobium sp. PL01]
MDKYSLTHFLHLAESHAKAVSTVRSVRQMVDGGDQEVCAAIDQAEAEEGIARSAVICWRPNSAIEAQTKFLYMAHFIANAQISLDGQEMATMMTSIEHLR